MSSPLRDLLALERLRLQFGPQVAGRKHALLTRLGPTSMPTAKALARLHEMLCFLRAYPDNEALLRDTCALLEGFARRPDLRRHRSPVVRPGRPSFSSIQGATGWRALEHRRFTRPSVSSPDSVVRSIRLMAFSSQAA